MAELSPEDIERRIGAKRLNERLKLLATSFNTIGLTVLAAAVLVPLVGGAVTLSASVWFSISLSLHLVAQGVLGRMKSED